MGCSYDSGPTTLPTDPTFLGLTATNWILVTATLIGPIIAVIITIVSEHFRSQAQRRTNIVYTILNTRLRPNDVQFQMAIMAVGVEYRKDEKVMFAHSEYMNHVGLPVAPGHEEAHNKVTGQKLVALLKLLFKRVGTEISEAEIDKMSYATIGVGMQDDLLHGALAAMIRIAKTLENQEKLMIGQTLDETDQTK